MRSLQEILSETHQNLKKKYIYEARLNAKADSQNGARHTEKYVDPYLPGKEKHGPETHALEADHDGIKKGTRITIKGKKVINGITHVHAVPAGGTKPVHIPINKLRKPSDKDGRHNEEHAVKKVWNHFSSKDAKTKKGLELHHMLGEIDKAEKDESHPLHIKNAEDHEFAGRVSGNDESKGDTGSRDRAKKSYYQNLRDAAHTVHAMKNHPDFHDHWKDGDTLEHSGKAKPELSEHYKKHGVRGAGATSKGDALILKSKKGTKGIKAISFKKTGGSQLMSSSPAEFHAIYSHAAKKAKINTPENIKKLEKARQHLEKGEHEKANKIVQKLHDDHPHLIHHVTEEALTGNGKFKTDDGRATHVAEIGKDAKVMTTKEFMKSHHDVISKSRPRVRASKHGGTQSTVSLETPKLPKRPVAKEVAKTIVKKRMKKA